MDNELPKFDIPEPLPESDSFADVVVVAVGGGAALKPRRSYLPGLVTLGSAAINSLAAVSTDGFVRRHHCRAIARQLQISESLLVELSLICCSVWSEMSCNRPPFPFLESEPERELKSA